MWKRTDLDYPSILRTTEDYEAVMAEARKRTAKADRDARILAGIAFYVGLAFGVLAIIIAATLGG